MLYDTVSLVFPHLKITVRSKMRYVVAVQQEHWACLYGKATLKFVNELQAPEQMGTSFITPFEHRARGGGICKSISVFWQALCVDCGVLLLLRAEELAVIARTFRSALLRAIRRSLWAPSESQSCIVTVARKSRVQRVAVIDVPMIIWSEDKKYIHDVQFHCPLSKPTEIRRM